MPLSCIGRYALVVSLLMAAAAGQTTFGTRFSVAFPPTIGDDQTGVCAIIVNARQTTDLRIDYSDGSFTDVVYPGQPFSFTVPCHHRTTAGTESKVYYVTTSANVTVMATNNNYEIYGGHMDATGVYAYNENNTEFYLLTYVDPSGTYDECGDTDNTAAFFVISAFENETQVEIYDNANYDVIFNQTLNVYECYTNTTTVATRRFDFTGFYIRSSKPVSVSAGNACTWYGDSTYDRSGVTWSYMPPVYALSDGFYLSSEIQEYSYGYYKVLVMATEDITFITIDGEQFFIDRGMVESNELYNDWGLVSCDKPCLVFQVNQNYDDYTGVFMFHVTPIAAYNQEVLFSAAPTLSSLWTPYVVITIASADPAPIQTEGLSTGSTWDCRAMGSVDACQLHTAMSPGSVRTQARVYTTDPDVKFYAVVYAQDANGQGYGYNAGFKTLNQTTW